MRTQGGELEGPRACHCFTSQTTESHRNAPQENRSTNHSSCMVPLALQGQVAPGPEGHICSATCACE